MAIIPKIKETIAKKPKRNKPTETNIIVIIVEITAKTI
jgi:hypothetical protein